MNWKRKIAWALVALVIALLTVKTVFSLNKDISFDDLLAMLRAASPVSITASLLCMFGFIFFEGISLQYILGKLNYRVNIFRGLIYSAGDQFFSAITPSASGGQPASALVMKAHGIPAAHITACLLMNLIMYTASTEVIGLACLILNSAALDYFDALSKVFIIGGIVILGFLLFIFILLMKKGEVLGFLEDIIISFLLKIHLIKDRSKWDKKRKKHLKDFALCAKMLEGKPGVLITVFILNLLQRLSQISVTTSFNSAFEIGRKVPIEELWTVQAFAQIGSYCAPIPGGMGVADYLMLEGFQSLFDTDYAFMLQILSRSISFYLCTLVSGLIFLAGYITMALKKKRDNKREIGKAD